MGGFTYIATHYYYQIINAFTNLQSPSHHTFDYELCIINYAL
jgi:hypothetical protein